MLRAEVVPYLVVVCQLAPGPAHLCAFAQRDCVELAEDLEGDFGGEQRDEVDLDEVAHLGGDEGELVEAGDAEDALEDELALLAGCRTEDGPHVLAIPVSMRFNLSMGHRKRRRKEGVRSEAGGAEGEEQRKE